MKNGVFRRPDANQYVFIFTAAVWLLIMLVYYLVQGYPHQDLLDTDAFTRLLRVEQLAVDHDWFSSVIPRSNAPYGETLHWTRPLDILLLAGAGLLTPLMGFKQALYWWGVVISPVLGVLSLAAMAWAAKSLLDEDDRRLVWLIFITQLLLVSVYHFGRPDHHSLLSLLFISLLGCVLRLVKPGPDRNLALTAGLLAGVAVWVSVEALSSVVWVFAVLAVLWLRQGEGYRLKMAYFAGALLLSAVLFVGLEHRLPLWLQFEYDRISAVHVIIFLLAALSAGLLKYFSRQGGVGRFCAAAAIAVADGVVLWLLMPDFFKGPFSQVNPAIIPIWLDWVIEVRPLLADSAAMIAAVTGSMAFALGYLSWQLISARSTHHREYVLTFLIGLLIFIPLTFYQIRWVYYCSALLVIPLAMFLGQLLGRLAKIRRPGWRALARAATILLFLCGFYLLGWVLDNSDNKNAAEDEKPDTRALCAWLNASGSGLPASAVIVVDMDYGPEILYRTPHQVIATPYHRNDAGILFNHRVMTAANAEAARAVMSERPVDLLILTPESSEKVIYQAEENPDIFYNQLLNGQVPEWLIPVQTPEEVGKWFLVFKVVT